MQTLNLDALDAADEPQPQPAVPRPAAGSFSHAYGSPDPIGAAAWCFAQHAKDHGPAPAPGDGHNAWLAAVTKFCNASGAYLSDVLALALDTAPPGHDMAKIEATVKGIYRRDAATHGSKPYTAPAGNKPNFTVPFGQKENAPPAAPPPTFPAAVYDALPDFLQRACYPFESHEKAVMLLGALAVLSGCFPGVGGTYGGRRYGLNLFAFIIAPAASGKGTLSWAQRLARPWHRRLLDESRRAAAAHAEDLAAHKASGGKTGTVPPAAPPRRLLYLPGDSTAAALIGALADNDGRGIICENEADTLTTALGGEHGKFADKLCKMFQQEPVTLTRKAERLHVELERPAVSIALTGTPGQLPRLMPTAENGLVSRFLFYTFSQPYEWRSCAPTGGPSLESYFDELGAELTRMIEATPPPGENGALGVEVKLTPADWQRLDAAGAVGLADAVAAAGGAGASTAYRLGLIAFRLAGLLTVLRCFEHGQAPVGTLEADPADVGTALAIMDTARAHALAVLATLPTPGGAAGASGKFTTKAEQLAQVQELRAQGLSYREIADRVGVSFSTVGIWLKTV